MSKLAKETKNLLRAAGWEFLREARGDHEIWHDPRTGKKVTVDHGMKSKHTANAILKQAGLPKSI